MLAWVARRSKRADGKERGRRIPEVGCNDRATPPAAVLLRAVDGCVDFGGGLRCSLGRDRCGYRHRVSRLGQRQNPQQRDPFQYSTVSEGKYNSNVFGIFAEVRLAGLRLAQRSKAHQAQRNKKVVLSTYRRDRF